VSLALAERSILAMAREDWPSGEDLAERALSVVQRGAIDDYPHSTVVYAAAARVRLHLGDVAAAQTLLGRAARLRPALTYAMPYFAVQTRLEMARAHVMLSDAGGARVLLREARNVIRLRPDLGTLPAQANELEARLDDLRSESIGASSLTAAELRLLPLLATHLSFREIGDRLFVSRHTVKTQAISVYRKLGVSSRSEAIRRAQEIGLLPT
jgi:LuxR family maltose regulon positive regulatory protein